MKLVKVAVMLATVLSVMPLRAQKFDNFERGRVKDMLHAIADDVRKDYYDPKLHGFDFDGRVREAEAKISEADSLGRAFRYLAWALDGLNDSHTYFVPPARINRTDYGWRMQMIGDHCYVTEVRPKSDAEAKGLKPGDEILSINGIPATRENFHVISYMYNILSPQPGLRLQLMGANGQPQQVDIASSVKQGHLVADLTDSGTFGDYVREIESSNHLMRTRCESVGDDLGICKLPEFNLSDDGVRWMLNIVHKHKAFILDLRDNPGGSVETLSRLAGGFFDHDVKIGDRIGRKEMKPIITKREGHAYDGKLVVLVDSQSASASEIFARMMQLEKRAIVIGDRSSGLVMEARLHVYKFNTGGIVFYGASITDADVVMTDGKSLEGRGVQPDEVVLPTADDLRAGRDPVLSHAAELVGVKLTPEQAGKLFPFEWPRQ
jgi:carboxyl-terminal processing protease